MKNDEKSWIFTISQAFLGNLGVETDHPPKMCAGLGISTCRTPLLSGSARRFANHHVRTVGIIGVSEAAQRAAVNASQKRQLRLIHDCAVRLIDFVTNMMDFSVLRQRRAAEGN